MDEFLPHSTRLLRRPLAQFVVGFASLGLFIYDNVKSRYLPLKVGRLGPSNNRASEYASYSQEHRRKEHHRARPDMRPAPDLNG